MLSASWFERASPIPEPPVFELTRGEKVDSFLTCRYPLHYRTQEFSGFCHLLEVLNPPKHLFFICGILEKIQKNSQG